MKFTCGLCRSPVFEGAPDGTVTAVEYVQEHPVLLMEVPDTHDSSWSDFVMLQFSNY